MNYSCNQQTELVQCNPLFSPTARLGSLETELRTSQERVKMLEVQSTVYVYGDNNYLCCFALSPCLLLLSCLSSLPPSLPPSQEQLGVTSSSGLPAYSPFTTDMVKMAKKLSDTAITKGWCSQCTLRFRSCS